jgi:hypothetical protein
LEELAAATSCNQKRAGFHSVARRWSPVPAFDEIQAAQRQIDPDEWK